MNNEIKRKITSLTLMTIMLAGGMFAAVPSMVPAAHAANANLFVSAENSQFDNYMSGPQVIEVVVIDSDINDTDQAKGEPDVTVNGKILRMVQGVDGSWYGYFADRNMAIIADSTASGTIKSGLDFGTFCESTDVISGQDFSDTVGVAIPDTDMGLEGSAVIAAAAGGPLVIGTTACTTGFDALAGNIVRESKKPSVIPGVGGAIGQIGLTAVGDWPFIQLYPLNPTGNVIVQYNKGGGVQTTTLTFDTVDQFAKPGLDRAVYTPGSSVHATITDLWLNIDPTDEDSWTFETVGDISTNYQVFDENGAVSGGAGVGNSASNTDGNLLTASLGDLMCEDNCVLRLNPDVQNKGFVATIQDNDDSVLSGDSLVAPPFLAGTTTGIYAPTAGTADDPTRVITLDTVAAANRFTLSTDVTKGAVPITFTEQGPNSGIFGSYDESDKSNIMITSSAKRGTSASVDYNETPVTILVGLNFATVDIKPIDAEWSSGEEIPVEVVDGDANKNSRADEDLDLNNPSVAIIPSLRTGTPVTLANGITAATLDGIALTPVIDRFSDRALLTTSAAVPAVVDDDDLAVTFGTMNDIFKSTPINKANFHGFALLNYDVRALKNAGNLEGITSVDITLAGLPNVPASSFTTQPLQGLILLDGPSFGALASGTALTVNFNMNLPAGDAVAIGTTLPIVVDIFGFGFTNDGFEDPDRIANQILRLELEETGDNTSTFAGTLEYTMINQNSILDRSTYTGLTTISDEASFVVIEDLDDEESPRVTYNDLGADGVVTQVSDQEASPAHSGIVSFSADTFKNADTVTITLEDLDLNKDTDLIDIYTVVTGSTITALNDVVGEDFDAAGNPVSIALSTGDQLGRLLDVTFDDQLWTTPTTGSCAAALPGLVGTDTGLGGTGFTLVETSKASGVFKGDFQIPSAWCRAGASAPESVTGLDIEVNYVDFRDASGETTEVGDSAGVRANTGSVSLDRTVYPVPFGIPSDFTISATQTNPTGRSLFPIHQSGMNSVAGLQTGEFIANGDLTIHVRVNDADFDTSATGEDRITAVTSTGVGPVKVSVIRGSDSVILGFAGNPTVIPGPINVGNTLIGDGKIGLGEFTITSSTGGFPAGAVAITQTGATTPGAGVFADVLGTIAISEVSVQAAATGMAPGLVTITQPAALIPATATWVDTNADGNIDTGELTILTAGTGFVTNTPVPAGPTVITVTDASTALTATLFFTDDVSATASTGEIALTAPPTGAGFTSGTITITPAPAVPGVSAIATFVDIPTVRQFGPMDEIAPDAGIFEADIVVRYTDGPADTLCPDTADFAPITGALNVAGNPVTDRFTVAPSAGDYCILQGDILQVEYTDPVDASGDPNTVTDSATFDLRNGVLQSDKSVYIIGSDMILTLIEPDFDLNNDQAETFDLDLIEWDSDAATVSMGDFGGQGAAFDPEPLNFRETGDSTGIYQIVIEIPQELENDRLERGEEIILEYKDWGPSGSDYVGDEDEDINLTVFTSNFGATVELDQKVYTWTDKVYITIVAPDHNFDGKLVDEIGNSDLDPIKVSTRGDDLDNYKLVETGTDTGIFTGEVILTGFTHDADGDTTTGTNGNDVVSQASSGTGPTDGLLSADDDDGITVAFEFSEDETIVGSALIRWNIGETQWLEASYPASGTGVVRIIDPDMNLDPEAVDNFNVDVWSDSDSGGIDLTVTETNEATGIFEGTVFFTTTDESSGHRLRVAEGDTVTAEYSDNTLPNPYTTADELQISATSLIGTIVPPLERAPIANCRVVDAFTNTLSSVSVDQQAQITCDVSNGQDREQAFAYLVQIQDGNGVTVSLAWITGSLSAGQSFSPALSWIPTDAGTYTATAFVWESVDNPTALSAPVATTVIVK